MTTTESEIVEMPHLSVQWTRIRGRLQAEVGEVEYRTWLRQMSLAGQDGDEITVTLPTRFLRDWLSTRYGDRLRTLWQAENADIRRVDIRVGTVSTPAVPVVESVAAPRFTPMAASRETFADTTRDVVPPVAARVAPVVVEDKVESRSDLAAPLDPRFTFDGFVVGKPNEFAYACARRVADMPSSPGFNPLFLYGGVGLGKTHLMHAIAWELTNRTSNPVSVAYMSAEKFMYRFIAAIRSQSTMEFKENLRSVDVLMIDDLQFLIGKDNTQEEFFHTFNYLVEQVDHHLAF